jgi:hypothetical protein
LSSCLVPFELLSGSFCAPGDREAIACTDKVLREEGKRMEMRTSSVWYIRTGWGVPVAANATAQRSEQLRMFISFFVPL